LNLSSFLSHPTSLISQLITQLNELNSTLFSHFSSITHRSRAQHSALRVPLSSILSPLSSLLNSPRSSPHPIFNASFSQGAGRSKRSRPIGVAPGGSGSGGKKRKLLAAHDGSKDEDDDDDDDDDDDEDEDDDDDDDTKNAPEHNTEVDLRSSSLSLS
jgi:hypothetical protein